MEDARHELTWLRQLAAEPESPDVEIDWHRLGSQFAPREVVWDLSPVNETMSEPLSESLSPRFHGASRALPLDDDRPTYPEATHLHSAGPRHSNAGRKEIAPSHPERVMAEPPFDDDGDEPVVALHRAIVRASEDLGAVRRELGDINEWVGRARSLREGELEVATLRARATLTAAREVSDARRLAREILAEAQERARLTLERADATSEEIVEETMNWAEEVVNDLSEQLGPRRLRPPISEIKALGAARAPSGRGGDPLESVRSTRLDALVNGASRYSTWSSGNGAGASPPYLQRHESSESRNWDVQPGN